MYTFFKIKTKFVLCFLVLSSFSIQIFADDTVTVKISPSEKHQKIDGFGFSTAWGNKVDSKHMDAFFSRKKGAGFSIIRTRIPLRENNKKNDKFIARKNGGKGDYDYKLKSQKYKEFKLNWNNWDLKRTKNLIAEIKRNKDYELPIFFSTPWTPPNNNASQWKEGIKYPTDHPEVGGRLKTDKYADYADFLADFVLGFEKNMGAPLHALSIQNEPNYKVKYESCDWTAEQFHEFLRVLGKQWEKKKVFKKLPNLTLIAPEHNNFSEKLIIPSLKDPNTSKLVGITGGHLYEYGWNRRDPLKINFKPMKTSIEQGKRIWMTEWSVQKFGKPNAIIPNLALAKSMHYLFTKAKLNAYVYWWTKCLVTDGKPNKALWTMAQYSRFVRPGWHRISADEEPVKNLLVSAFLDPKGTELTIVVVNIEDSPRSIDLSLQSNKFTTLKAYRTSAKENMKQLDPVKCSGNSAKVSVPGKSITTFHAKIR